MKSQNKIVLIIVGILSTSIVFAMGKVEAGDWGKTAASATQTKAKRHSFIDVDRAQSNDEKRRMLLEMIKNDSETEERWDVENNEQIKRDAAYELLSLKPTREDIQAIVDQIYKEKSITAKKELLDAISNSPYKDVTASAYKNIAENDEDLFFRGKAIGFLVQIGYESEGFEYLKQMVEFMNQNNELVRYFSMLDRFKSEEFRDKVKKYFIQLKNDGSKVKTVRCFAAIVCHNNYNTELESHYQMIEEVLMDKQTKKNTAIYLLDALPAYDKENQNVQRLIKKASESKNDDVKRVAEEILRTGNYSYK